MILINMSVLQDNYIWILSENHSCIIIDPGVSDLVIEKISKNKLYPEAILLTHFHKDHTGGVKELLKKYPKLTVFGPKETKNYNVHKIVKGGDTINLLTHNIKVFDTPGHTLGHISYYLNPYLFCGDTLFSSGCGRVYKNSYLYMYNSIQLIKSFPNNTILCCSHEYTLSNLIFAMNILPKDKNLFKYYKKVKKKTFLKKNIFPFHLYNEKKNNIFLRTDEIYLKKYMNFVKNESAYEIFCYLRKYKNFFGAKRD